MTTLSRCFSALWSPVVLACALLALTASLRAANTASDNAGNYGSSWGDGSNAGTGFGAWSLSTTSSNAGYFLGSSTVNGNGNSGNINSAANGRAFGLYANNNNNDNATANAIRSFTGGSLAVGQTFSMRFDNGGIDNGGVVGFQLLSSSNLNINPSSVGFGFTFTGGDTAYRVTGSLTGSTLPFTADGMSTSFTLLTATTYSFTVNQNSGASQTFLGTLSGSLDGIRFYNFKAGNGDSNNLYFNDLAVTGVPEPSTYLGGALLVALAGGTFLRAHRRTA